MAAPAARPRSREVMRWPALVIGLAAVLYGGATWLLDQRAIADDDTMARTVTAWLTLFGAHPSPWHLTRAGAPLFLLLQLPLAALPVWPAAVWSSATLSCASAALLLAAIHRGLVSLGLGGASRGIILGLCAIQPLLVFSAATGSAGTLAAALTAWALALLLEWSWNGRTLPLILSAFVLGLACLASYWLLLLALALLGVLLLSAGDRDRAVALAMTYALPIVSIVLPWQLVVLLLGRGPASFAPGNPLPLPGSGDAPAAAIAAGYLVMLSMAWCLVGRGPTSGTARPLLGAACGALMVSPMVALLVSGHIRPEQALPALPAAALALAWRIAQARGAGASALAAAALGLLAAVQLAVWNSGLGTASEERVAQLVTGQPGSAEPVERTIARAVTSIGSARDVLIDDRLAYPVAYWAGGVGRFYVPGDAVLQPSLLDQPPAGVRYLLVSHLSAGRGLDALDTTFSSLRQKDAAWAVLNQEWPGEEEGTNWRLYTLVGRA